ncbi:conserved Plasmodium protein, unknown function [Plasmodium ovale]|uniref:RAP protein n=1 Tax=Plasmodium ovale TaxID=36330 RepID=A0A1C3KWR8_PLAOA|nr:conserved Plasmodium protein, unknown function [Plasmodium ovale]
MNINAYCKDLFCRKRGFLNSFHLKRYVRLVESKGKHRPLLVERKKTRELFLSKNCSCFLSLRREQHTVGRCNESNGENDKGEECAKNANSKIDPIRTVAVGYETNRNRCKDQYNEKIFSLLLLLKRKRKRDCNKLKLISKHIFSNLSWYNIDQITKVLYCTYFFSIILKKEDLHRLIKRLKVLTFNKKDGMIVGELALNLLRIRIPKENVDKKVLFDLTNFMNDLLRALILYNNHSTSYFDYVHVVREIQLISHHRFCSWVNNKLLDDSVLNFMHSFQNPVVKQNRNLDYIFINEVIDILYKLNCEVSDLSMYNYTIPIFLKELNLIIECISSKNTFEGTLIVTPYFMQRYKLFKKLNFRILFLYKQLLPLNEEERMNFVKKSLYDAIK